MGALWLMAMVGIGAATWTLLEYLLHRFLGHRWRRNAFGAEHTRHHVEAHYFAPSAYKAAAAAVIAAVQSGLMLVWLPWPTVLAYGVGLWGGYALYEVLHRRTHTRPPRHAYGRWRRRHHFWHHFGDARVNHGVTTPLWDRVFGTLAPPQTVRVPRKLAMRWLCDEAGEVRSELRGDYALRG